MVTAWLDGGHDLRAGEAATLREWLSREPENPGALEDFDNIWKLGQAPPSPPGWPALASRIERGAPGPRLEMLPRSQRGSLVRYLAAAAVVIAVALGVHRSGILSNSAPPTQPTIVTVPAAAMSMVELAGGVVIRLNSVSTLSYSAPSAGVQEVRLSGEGYFAVPHDPNRIFRVVTDVGTITDLGTEFNVHARSGKVAVTVVQGVAELEAAGRKVSLRAGQSSSALAGAQPARPESANLTAALSWTEGRLVFFDETLETVGEALTRRYGVPFSVSDDLKAVRLTAAMAARESADAAAAVCAAVSAHCAPMGAGWSISRSAKR